MNKIAFIFIILFILLFLFGFAVAEAAGSFVEKASKIEVNSDLIANQIFAEINKIRLESGREPLKWDQTLHKIANSYSQELSAQGYINHRNVKHEDFLDRYHREKIFFFMGGENLFQGPATDNFHQQVIDGWMKSPRHRSLLVDADNFFTHGAIGVACSSVSCVVVLNLADFIDEVEVKISPQDFIYYSLNDPSYGLQDNYPVKIYLKSSQPVDFYVFDNIDQLRLFKYAPDYSRITKHQVSSLSLQTEAKKASYLLIFNDNLWEADVFFKLVYNEEVAMIKND